MYIARLTVISESCVVPFETAGNVMVFYADVVIIDNHSFDVEIDELSALRQSVPSDENHESAQKEHF